MELVSGSHIIVSRSLLLKCKNDEPETNFTHYCIARMFMINDQLYPLNTVGHLYTGPLTYYGDFRKLGPQVSKKVQVGKDQEKAQSEKDSHSKHRGGKKPN